MDNSDSDPRTAEQIQSQREFFAVWDAAHPYDGQPVDVKLYPTTPEEIAERDAEDAAWWASSFMTA